MLNKVESMNTYEQNINSWLNDESTFSSIEDYLESNPEHEYPVNNIQIRLDKSIKTLKYLQKVILQSIDNGIFEQLPTPIQLNINNQVQSIFQYRTNVNQQIVNVQNLYQQVMISNIEYNLKSYDRFKKPLSEIADLKRTYSSTLKGLNVLTAKVDKIQENYNRAIDLMDSFTEQKELIDNRLDETIETFEKSDKLFEEIASAKQEVENSKKDITAFKANIDSYKYDIKESTTSSSKIIADFEEKRENVNRLISDSEKALGLKSTQGISAALSVQYEKEDAEYKRKQWLVSSLVFLGIALLGVFLLIIKFNIGDKEIAANGTNEIVARIVFVAISIGATSFCAKQYLRQKNLADNYGYKLVLAKSIVAFAQEIKKHDPKRAAEYLNNVLEEINKSPIPNSKGDSEGITSKNLGLIERIIEAVKGK